jgi:antitoxin PrlF
LIATITSKGQVTLPKSVRDRLKLHIGDKLDFIVQNNGHLEVIPVKSSITELKGMVLPPKHDVSLKDMEKAIAEGAASDWD